MTDHDATTQAAGRLLRLELLGLAAIVAVFGVGPFLSMLDQWPWGADATKWLSYGNIESKTWTNWVFFHKHFIGYRPVTALTYVLNSAAGGYRPFGYRLVDLCLHGAVGVGIWGVLRLWLRSPWALLGPLSFFLHPAAEVVVPYVSRRSYSLGLTFGLGFVAAFTLLSRTPFGTWRTPVWLLASTALLALGLFANETVFVLLPLLPLLALHVAPAERTWWRSLLLCLPAWAMGAIAAAVRVQVLGKVGGYEKFYFAYAEDGRNKLRNVVDPDALEIFFAAWSYLLFPTGASGQDSLLAGRGGAALLVAEGILTYYVWRAVLQPLWRIRDPDGRGVGLAALWFGGLALLYALTGTWFWRQGYPLAVPFSLVWTWVLADTVRTQRGPALLAHLVPQVALLASFTWHSPIFGLDPKPLETRRRGSHIVNAVLGQADLVRDGSVLWLAPPARQPLSHIARIWITRSTTDRDLMVKLLAVYGGMERDPTMSTVEVVMQDDRLRVLLHEDMRWYKTSETSLRLEPTGAWLDRIRIMGRDNYLVSFDGDDVVMRPVPVAPDDAEPPQPRRIRRKRSRTRLPPVSDDPPPPPDDPFGQTDTATLP
ncbi:MAG: hypothetical protein ACI8PZ_000287 [Myxococcota bacterium]|jgi:hypothetical protein